MFNISKKICVLIFSISLLLFGAGFLHAAAEKPDTTKKLKSALFDTVVPVKPVQDIIWGYLSGWSVMHEKIEADLRNNEMSGVSVVGSAFTADGKFLATCLPLTPYIREIDIVTGKTRRDIVIDNYKIVSPRLLYSADGKYLAVCSGKGNSTLILDAPSYKNISLVDDRVPFCFTPDGSKLICQDSEEIQKIVVCDMQNPTRLKQESLLLLAETHYMLQAQCSWDNKYVVVRYYGAGELFNLQKQNAVHKFDFLRAAAWSHDGQLATSTGDNKITVWKQESVDKFVPCGTLDVDHKYIFHLIWSIDSKTIFALSTLDCTVKIWDIKTGTCLNEFKNVMGICYSPRGGHLALVLLDGSIQLLSNDALELEAQARELEQRALEQSQKTAAGQENNNSCVIS